MAVKVAITGPPNCEPEMQLYTSFRKTGWIRLRLEKAGYMDLRSPET
jgi:hypothetical protein